jgi:hypothetical protein
VPAFGKSSVARTPEWQGQLVRGRGQWSTPATNRDPERAKDRVDDLAEREAGGDERAETRSACSSEHSPKMTPAASV